MGSDEEVGQVISGDIAGDRLIVAGRVGVFENGFVVARVNPNELEWGGACVGFGAIGNAGEIKESDEIIGSTDGDQSTGSKWGGRKHVVVRRGW